MKRLSLGRHIYGLAAILYGIVTFLWPASTPLRQFKSVAASVTAPFGYLTAALLLVGGVAIQFSPSRRLGAVSLGIIYLVFALLALPFIFMGPLVYNNWGNFFEQSSLSMGALIVFGSPGLSQPGAGRPGPGHPTRPSRLARFAYFAFGISTLSFALEQLAYLDPTAALVPKWLPPSQMFWAVATTVFFALAAVAILTGRAALLASRLLTAMLMGFGVMVWLPILVSDPHQSFHWTEAAVTFVVAGVAWIVADHLKETS